MELQNGLYSRQVYWPNEIQNQTMAFVQLRRKLRPTNHYLYKCRKLHIDYGAYKMALHGEIIECEWQNGLQKIVTRIRDLYKPSLDVCFAIQINGWIDREVIIKTVWYNEHTDNHVTINKTNYVKEI